MGKVRRLTHEEIKQLTKRNELDFWLHEAGAWVKGHLEAVIIGAVVLGVGVFGGYYFISSQREARDKASMDLYGALSQAQRAKGSAPLFDPQALSGLGAAYQAVASSQSGAPAGLAAELGLADVEYASGRFEAAAQAYDKFAAANNKSLLAPLALQGKAACLEAQGKAPDALSAYLDLAEKHPQAPNKALVLLAAARVAESLKDPRLAQAASALAQMKSEGSLPKSLEGQVSALLARLPANSAPSKP